MIGCVRIKTLTNNNNKKNKNKTKHARQTTKRARQITKYHLKQIMKIQRILKCKFSVNVLIIPISFSRHAISVQDNVKSEPKHFIGGL